jgi:tetratricopeptide (TPR) repeat protein
MTITALVGQALRNGFRTREQIEDFVFQLRSGEAEIDDDESEGRSKSLGASLSYGFKDAFTEEERQQLALLYFFQGFTAVDALRLMGSPEQDWCVPTVRGLTFEAGKALLDRAAEVGLVTRLVENYYNIHPALPWYFKKLFDQYYPLDEDNNRTLITRAFVEAMGVLGNYYCNPSEQDNLFGIAVLTTYEANLLHARELARANGWWLALTKTMQGLRQLYNYVGRRAEWRRLVEEIVPDFIDPATDRPLPGREEEWGFITQYRVQLAMEARQWGEAERLQQVCVDWDRQRAASALTVSLESLDRTQRHAIRTLATSLHQLGQIQREKGKPESVAAYEESLILSEQIGEQAGAASCAFNLGHAHMDIANIRDLEQAERWYQRSLELRDQCDRQGRGQCLAQLGQVALERFREAQAARQSEEELLRHLNDALQFSYQALPLYPPNAVDDLAVTHNALGAIYQSAGDIDRALSHSRQAILYEEAQGNLYGAAGTRLNIAVALAKAGRFDEALLYAQSALPNYENYGYRAATEIHFTQRLIAQIERDLKAKGV